MQRKHGISWRRYIDTVDDDDGDPDSDDDDDEEEELKFKIKSTLLFYYKSFIVCKVQAGVNHINADFMLVSTTTVLMSTVLCCDS